MDRAAFLRASNYLVPLPPRVWESVIVGGGGDQHSNDHEGNDSSRNDEGTYSGSTITPPTPSSKHTMASMLFDQLNNCVVSIEPTTTCVEDGEDEEIYCKDGRASHDSSSSILESGQGHHCKILKNHDREEEVKSCEGYVIRRRQNVRQKNIPAFFAQPSFNNRIHDTVNESNSDGIDEKFTNQLRIDQINSDPSICTFQAAFVHEDALLSCLKELDSKRVHDHCDTMIDIQESKRKVLLFRFGHHFVFQVNDLAVVDVKYEPGYVIENDTVTETKDGCSSSTSPMSKRRKLESGRPFITTEKSDSTRKATISQVPSSVIIIFNSYSLRIFSLDQHAGSSKVTNDALEETNRPSSQIWSTLKRINVQTVEDSLINARTVLLQHLDIDNNRRNGGIICPSLWKMAPPGSGLAFHVWPERIVDSLCFHRVTRNLSTRCLESGAILSELWPCCLKEKRVEHDNLIQCSSSVTASPRKTGSPSKSSGSSTRFEHGQNEQAPTTNSPHSSSVTTAIEIGINFKHDVEERLGVSDQTSMKTSLEDSLGPGQIGDSGENGKHHLHQSSSSRMSLHDLFETRNSQEPPMGGSVKKHLNGMSSTDDGQSHRKEKETDIEECDERSQPIWIDETCKKFKSFGLSATHIDKAIHSSTFAALSSHLTSCADLLSASYQTMNEFMIRSQECEDDINRITIELESILDMMLPVRGGKKMNEVVTCEKSEEFKDKITELMSLRKEAVATKVALLLMPKR